MPDLGIRPSPAGVEGYMYPTTYVVPMRMRARDLMKLMTHEFIARWQPEWDARSRHPAEPRRGRGLHVPDDVRRPHAHARPRPHEADDARVHRALAAGVGCPARRAAHDATPDRHPRLDHRSRSAIHARPAIRLRGLSQPAQARNGTTGRSDRRLRARPPVASCVGETAANPLPL